MKRASLPADAVVHRGDRFVIVVCALGCMLLAVFVAAMAAQWRNDTAKFFLAIGAVLFLLLLRYTLRQATGYVALAGDKLCAGSLLDRATEVDLRIVTGYTLEVTHSQYHTKEDYCLYVGEKRVLASSELPFRRDWVRKKLRDRHYPPAFFPPETAEHFQVGRLTVDGPDLILDAGTKKEQRVSMCQLHLEKKALGLNLTLPDGTCFSELMYQMPHVFRLAWALDRNGVFVRSDYLPTL